MVAKTKKKVAKTKKKVAKKAPVKQGRPTKLNPTEPYLLSIVNKLAAEGRTTEQIAEYIGVSRNVIFVYQRNYLEFEDALRSGRDAADLMVEQALFSRAVGYVHKEAKVVSEGRDGGSHIEHVDKFYPPDTAAATFWLKNRKPEDWKDRPEGDEPDVRNASLVAIPTDDIIALLNKRKNANPE